MTSAVMDTARVWWQPAGEEPAFSPARMAALAAAIRTPLHVVQDRDSTVGLARGGRLVPGDYETGYALLFTLPPVYPEWLGDPSFGQVHGTRFPYVAGAMANGIHSSRMTIALGQAGMLGFFGAAGLSIDRIDAAIGEIKGALGEAANWGSNLIHTPMEPTVEEAVVDLYLRRGVHCVSASAYMGLTPAVVRYAFAGIYRDERGQIQRPNRLFAKLSRPEVARRFLSPPPNRILQQLVERGHLLAEEAELAVSLPVAEDVTAEADSGGHTDNRPLTALVPTILGVRDELARRYGYERPIRVGAAGGLGVPAAIAAAFATGAAFVVTGSVNQATVEADQSDAGKALLAEAGLADVVMAPAADMFELGVDLQVLRRGTMFASRAKRLYRVYVDYPSLEAIPAEIRQKLEEDLFRQPLDETWASTRGYWMHRDQAEVEKAERDPKHKMALVFRSYLGLATRWALTGDPDRRVDYQVWCGPAMGAFNEWVRGSFLEPLEERTVVQVGLNLLEGAALLARAQQLRSVGVPVPPEMFQVRPGRFTTA